MSRRGWATLAVLWIALGPTPDRLSAQANQPVYPAYDGFIKNPDGSVTLAFAYFNHNADPITIPPGSTNLFAPDPSDRQQPTTFLPGHHRFQCVMVVDPGFDGKLRWTLSYAGTTTSTSENMLQYSWELEDASVRQVMRGIDLKTAPRGVCINRPPTVRVLGLSAGSSGDAGDTPARQASRALAAAVTLPNELRLFGAVDDEGLPREGKLAIAWKAIKGPGTVTFSDPSAARTRASFSAPGSYELELWASDSMLEGRARVAVTVKAAP